MTMEPFIKEVLTQGGPLGVLVVVVYIFVRDRHVASQEHRAWMDQLVKENHEVMRMMHSEHLEARLHSREAMEKNAAAMQEFSRAVGGCELRRAK